MALTTPLLAQIRRAAALVSAGIDNPALKNLLHAVDVALNTLQLQESPQFYLDYIASGRQLLEQGAQLASLHGVQIAIPALLQLPLHDTMRNEVFEAQIVALRGALSDVVNTLEEARSEVEKAYLVRMSDWDSGFHTHHLQQAVSADTAPSASITRNRLESYLQQKFPEWLDLRVDQFFPLDGGFSKRTILFEATDRLNGARALVMRAEQGVDLLRYEGSDVTQEFHMIKLMRNAGLPIAEPLWLESDTARLGCRFIVSRKAHGKTHGGALGSNEAISEELVQSMLATLAAVHRVSVDIHDPLAQKSHLKEWLPHAHSLRETTRYYVTEFLPRIMRLTGVAPAPQIQRCLKWLAGNVPESDEAAVIIHGDFSFNNLIIDNNQITAILDWESSRLGDPAEDIIWTQQNIGAYVDMPEFLRRYTLLTGRAVSAQRLAYLRVAKCAFNAITCLSAAKVLDQRADANLNLAVLAYHYMPLFGSQFNVLIEAAESL